MRQYGHLEPETYALGVLADEVELVQARVSADTASQMVLWRQVLATIPNQSVRPGDTRAANRGFKETMARLMGRNGEE